MRILPSVVLGLIMFVSSSCIKENRMDCPCYLVLDVSRVDRGVFGQVEVGILSADGFSHTAVLSGPELDENYTVKVPRGVISLCAFYADKSGSDALIAPRGSSFPELWLYGRSLKTNCDVVRDTVRLHKSFCRLTIHLLSDGSPSPFSVSIDSPVCGYHPDGSLYEGVFQVALEPDSMGVCSVCVPRQMDDSMGLSLVDSGSVVRRFSLGHYIEASGFDWGSPDLEDLDLTVDFSRTTISFSISNWEETHEFFVEI